MENNDVIRRFRYALNISDATMVNIFKMAECKIEKTELLNLLKKKGEPGYAACSTDLLERFFDGLILYNRGAQSDNSSEREASSFQGEKENPYRQQVKVAPATESLENNLILKKIRIALDLKQEDMMEIFRLGEVKMAKGEFTALFRKKGHKNYKECGDQYLKKFLEGLAIRHRI